MTKKQIQLSKLLVPIATLLLLPVLVFSFVNTPTFLKNSQKTLFEFFDNFHSFKDLNGNIDKGQVLGDAAECPVELINPILTTIEIDSSNFSVNDYEIDCSQHDILITSSGILRILPDYTNNSSHEDDLSLTIIARNFEIQTGGILDLEGLGYGSGEQELHVGSGKPSVECSGCGGSGGGHGGAGGRGDTDNIGTAGNPGQSYGDRLSPNTLGSGGGISSTDSFGGAGGGAIQLVVSEIFTLNGEINANGLDGESDQGDAGGGAGAGGSIWIEAGGFEGSGQANARGGDGGVSSRIGGGGGGGRINMICGASNISNFTVDIDGGTGGSQDGGYGSLVGPSCEPHNPSNLRQYAIIETINPPTYNEIELEEGDGTRSRSIMLRFEVSDVDTSSTLYPEIELREVGESFIDTYTHTIIPVSYSGVPVMVEKRIDNLDKTKEYKWRVRVKDDKDVYSAWSDFAQEEGIDFIIIGDPYQLWRDPDDMVSGNNQTGTVDQELSSYFIAEVQDSVGHPVPDVSVSWQIKTGGGEFSEQEIITDSNGQIKSLLKLGTKSGVDNNTVEFIKTGLASSPMVFTSSALADTLHHYYVQVPSITIQNSDFLTVIEARDRFENFISSYTGSVDLDAVISEPGCPEVCQSASGVLTPLTTSLVDGIVEIGNTQYNQTGSIKIKVTDGTFSGYSNTVNVVDSYGNCFGVANDLVNSPFHIEDDLLFEANESNWGIIDCSNIDVVVDAGVTITLRSYDNGDACFGSSLEKCFDDFGVTLYSKNLTIGVNAKITSDGLGYQDKGPGTNPTSSSGGPGGSYGGFGAGYPIDNPLSVMNRPYGSVFEPMSLGSAGTPHSSLGLFSNGGHGGGAIKIVVSEVLSHNGIISSNGIPSSNWACSGLYGCPTRSGGSGGSIWIDTSVLNGSGQIVSNGAQEYTHGSGGRIAIYFEEGTYPFFNIATSSTSVHAKGGNAGAGTIYVENKLVHSSKQGDLFIDNELSTNTGLAACLEEDTYSFNSLTLNNFGHLDILGNSSRLLLVDSNQLKGNSTSRLTSWGTLEYAGAGYFELNNLTLINRGDLIGFEQITIAANTFAELVLYASTWARSGSYEFENIHIQNNGKLKLVSYESNDTNWANDYGATLEVTNIEIDTNAKLYADGTGYGTVSANIVGPGGGLSPGCSFFQDCNYHGGSYGGYGSRRESYISYGDVFTPTDLGSGGSWRSTNYGYATKTSGGGAIKLITNDLVLNGEITANGSDGERSRLDYGGSGSGGSVWIETSRISGNGYIKSDGGAPTVGLPYGSAHSGGSGGRIALYYQENIDFPLDTISSLNPNISARGFSRGGAGTIYIEQFVMPNQFSYDQNLYINNQIESDTSKQATLSSGYYQFESITQTNFGHLDIQGSTSHLVINSISGLLGDLSIPKLIIEGTIYAPYNFNINGIDLGIKGRLEGMQNLVLGDTIKSGLSLYASAWGHTGLFDFESILVNNESVISLVSNDNGNSNYTDDYGVILKAEILDILVGGKVTSDGFGYGANYQNTGPGGGGAGGVGSDNVCGASYGGYGQLGTATGSIQTIPYGDVYEPSHLGSAGSYMSSNNKRGGGAIKLDISSILNNDGIISSNGLTDNSDYRIGSGSGGSIWIEAREINGNGIIQANGGEGYNHGSGGRVAVYFEDGNFPVSNTSTSPANTQSRGGPKAGAGTIYVEQKNYGEVASLNGDLYVDNNLVLDNLKSAALVSGVYSFNKIELSRFGNLTVLGAHNASRVTIESGMGLHGDHTIPNLTIEGVIIGPENIVVDGVDVGIKGDKVGFENLILGDSIGGGFTIYEHTWAHQSITDHFVLGDITINNNSSFTLDHGNVATDVSAYIHTDGKPINLVEINDLVINNGGSVVLKSYDNGNTNYDDDYGVYLLADFIQVEQGGKISSDEFGYSSSAKGPGGANYFDSWFGCNYCKQGASYGGFGGSLQGVTQTSPYGNVYQPSHLGSTANGRGGGSIRIGSNILNLNGTISADALNNSSGGSIWMEVGIINGVGMIRANGGGSSNGGSGGRIALYYEDGDFPITDIATDPAHIQSRGGTDAGAGTIYIEQKALGATALFNGDLYIDNNLVSNNEKSAVLVEGDYSFNTLNLTRSGNLRVLGVGNGCSSAQFYTKQTCLDSGIPDVEWDSGSTLTLLSEDSIKGDSSLSGLFVEGTLITPDSFNLKNIHIHLIGDKEGFNNLQIGTGGPARLTVYEHTWAHKNIDNPTKFGNVGVLDQSELIFRFGDFPVNYSYPPTVEFDNLTLEGGSKAIIRSTWNNNDIIDDDYGFTIKTNQDLRILAGAVLDAKGQGFNGSDQSFRGPGAGSGGASHGGYGGYYEFTPTDGKPYGDLYEPLNIGSRGMDSSDSLILRKGIGGKGGGGIKLNIFGELLLQGIIDVSGDDWKLFDFGTGGCEPGGGSGGSLWIDTNQINLQSSAYLKANGGFGKYGVVSSYCDPSIKQTDGAGGRIALYYNESIGMDLVGDTVSGHIQSRGRYAGPGTVYIENKLLHNPKQGDLYIDNVSDITGITNYAYGTDFEAGEWTFNNIYIGKNAKHNILSNTSYENENGRVGKGVVFDLTGNLILAEGSYLDLNGQGFSSDDGLSKGMPGVISGGGNGSGGGGAGYGGAGGAGQNEGGLNVGGENGDASTIPYLQIQPLYLGSGGGTSGAGALGGSGGGAIAVFADGIIDINGTISANGLQGKASSPGGGGGAGGSIYLTGSEIFLQSGSLLSVRGGDGGATCSLPAYSTKSLCELNGGIWGGSEPMGGGGGGGIIFLGYTQGLNMDGLESTLIDKQGGFSINLGQEGIFGLKGLASMGGRSQHQLDDEAIPLGGVVNQRAVNFKLTIQHPDDNIILYPEVEVQYADEGLEFNETHIIRGEGFLWEIGAPVEEIVQFQNQVLGISSDGNEEPQVLGISSDDLEYGGSYKWRARVVDDLGVTTGWVEFGNNGDSPDFFISSISCGNNIIEPSQFEECDGTNLGGQTCQTRGFDFGTLSCSVGCIFDESGCGNWMCGNGIVEPLNGEQCEVGQLGGMTCSSFGFDAGILGCSGCLYNTASCYNYMCGNGTLEPGEECDDGNNLNGDGCNSVCQTEAVPTPTNTPVPTATSTPVPGATNTPVPTATSTPVPGATNTPVPTATTTPVPGETSTPIPNLTTLPVPTESISPVPEETSIPILPVDCGDGILQEGEECDDGNNIDGDGCTSDCREEPVYILTSQQAIIPMCGNDILEPGEQCDGEVAEKLKCSDFQGFAGGKLSCRNDCIIDLSGCYIPEDEGRVLTSQDWRLPLFSVLIGSSLLWVAFPFILLWKKKKWGVIYDFNTHKVIDFAIVKLLKNQNTVSQIMTKKDGKYRFVISKGTYEVEAKHEDYQLERKYIFNLFSKEKLVKEDIYLIPNIGKKFDMKKYIKMNIRSIQGLVVLFSQLVFIFAFVYSMIATFKSPTILNILIIGLYLVQIFIYLKFSKDNLSKIDNKT